jgi:hypothetical protein
MIERYNYLAVTPSKFIEASCLLLKKRNERFKRAACLELGGKWMFDEVCPCSAFIFLAGSLKQCLKD